MLAFFFRLSSLAIRFLCPLAILALSNAETMGNYYIFTSYFTFFVGISALEMGVPFSRRFLRCNSEKRRRCVFSGFLVNLAVVTTVVAIPASLFVASWAGVSNFLIPLFFLSLVTEACVNEVGRFFWNIGEWRSPSLRDLVRAVIFTAAIVGSVYFEQKVLTSMTFLIITAGNLCIMGWEMRFWGMAPTGRVVHPSRLLRSVWARVRRSLAGSLPQFLQMQLLGLQPLLERKLLEKALGLSELAAFAFLTSLMQSAAGLVLVPMVAKTRRGVLGSQSVLERVNANRQALLLLFNICVISGAIGFLVFVGLPLINALMEKEISATFFIALIAYLSSVAAIFCSAIAPLLTVKKYASKANALTFLALAPLFVAQWKIQEIGGEKIGLIAIGIVALLLVLGRVAFINCVLKRLTIEP